MLGTTQEPLYGIINQKVPLGQYSLFNLCVITAFNVDIELLIKETVINYQKIWLIMDKNTIVNILDNAGRRMYGVRIKTAT